MTIAVERINKSDAASRQLNAAVRMFFRRDEPLAVHTIAHASHQVLSDLCKSRGLLSYVKNNPLLRPEKAKEWIEAMNQSANFLKHADRDAEAILEFRPATTEFFIQDCCAMINSLGFEVSFEANLFLSWFGLKYPELLSDGLLKEQIQVGLSMGIDPDDFSLLQELIERNDNAA